MSMKVNINSELGSSVLTKQYNSDGFDIIKEPVGISLNVHTPKSQSPSKLYLKPGRKCLLLLTVSHITNGDKTE